ncbi:MAG: phosphopantothenate/pantothenate synthetase family protein, partial [Promethearchaeota archaeon]
MTKKNRNIGIPNIPNDHPRAESLHYRHKLVDLMFEKVVTPSGLCAHGRGEAFDYLLGEQTIPPSEKAMEAAIASLLLAKHPVFSINGNVAALVPESIVELAEVLDADIEINIFYQAPGRIEAITSILKKAGAKKILGLGDVEPTSLPNISSNRRIVDPRGIFSADVVLVPLED